MAKTLQGRVISTKMNKTVVVSVERVYRHKLYKKIIRKNKKYKAHNDKFDLKIGDMVVISEVRPISKDKNFIVTQKIS